MREIDLFVKFAYCKSANGIFELCPERIKFCQCFNILTSRPEGVTQHDEELNLSNDVYRWVSNIKKSMNI